jgi:hypothetical protein
LECLPAFITTRDLTFRGRLRQSTSAAALVASQPRAPREQTPRTAIRPRATGISQLREATALRYRGLRPHTRRTTAVTATVHTTVVSRATVRMAHTTGLATVATTVRLRATHAQARAITARLQAIAVRSQTMAAEVIAAQVQAIAVQVRATAVQLLAMAADRTAGRHRVMIAAPLDDQRLPTEVDRTVAQLRRTAAVAARWVPTVAEVERHPTAAAVVDVREASVVEEADPTEVAVMLPRRVAAEVIAAAAVEAITGTGKLQV